MGQARGGAARALGGWLPDSFALGWRKAERKHLPLGMVAGFFRPRGLAGGLRLPGLRPLGSRRPHAGPIGGDDQIDCVPPRGSRAPRDRRAGPSPCAPAVSAQSVRSGGLRPAKPRRLPEAGTEPAPAGPPRLRAVFRAHRGGFGSRSGRLPPSRPQAGWRPRGRKPGGAAARSAVAPPRQGPGKASPSRSQGRQPRPGKAPVRPLHREAKGGNPAPARTLHREAIGDHSAKRRGPRLAARPPCRPCGCR